MIAIKVYINKHQTPLVSAIDIADTDDVYIEISSTEKNYFNDREVDILLEDYKIPYTIDEYNSTATSKSNNLFRESFGYNTLKLFIDGEPISDIIFHVSTSDYRFKHIKGMMSYLLENNNRILDLCFSRNKNESKNNREDTASFDSVISLAEKIVYSFIKKGAGLKNQLRHKLELIKENANGHNFYHVNPYDVIDHLDQLHQGYSQDCITLLGKVYSMEAITRETHINSFDVEENKVLLGGLLSLKEVLLGILSMIDDEPDQSTDEAEYKDIKPFSNVNGYVIEDLYAQLTTIGMEKRIHSILKPIDELLYFFRKELKVTSEGFYPPILSAFSKKSSFYLTLYQQLNEWYALGHPKLCVDHDLTKIRSTSKIYELFTLYKMIDSLYKDGWYIDGAVEHRVFKNFIPAQVDFYKGDALLSIFYEKKINGFGANTQHNDLIALNKNSATDKYNYYHPDFIIRINRHKTVSYFILDAKYSSSNTLKNYKVLDVLYEKYFSNLAVYNQDSATLEKQAIKSVNAIHPFGDKALSKWPTYLPKITPDVSSILLSKDTNGFGNILKLINEVV